MGPIAHTHGAASEETVGQGRVALELLIESAGERLPAADATYLRHVPSPSSKLDSGSTSSRDNADLERPVLSSVHTRSNWDEDKRDPDRGRIGASGIHVRAQLSMAGAWASRRVPVH